MSDFTKARLRAPAPKRLSRGEGGKRGRGLPPSAFAAVCGRPARARRAGPSTGQGFDPLTLLDRRGGPYPGPGPARARSCAEPPWPGCALAGAIHAKESLGRVPLPPAMAPALPPEPVRSTPARFGAHRCSGRRWRLFPTPSLRRAERLDHDGRGLPRCPGSVHGAPPPARLTWRTGGAPLFTPSTRISSRVARHGEPTHPRPLRSLAPGHGGEALFCDSRTPRLALHAGGSGPQRRRVRCSLTSPRRCLPFPTKGAVPVWCAPRSREAGEGSLLSRHGAFSSACKPRDRASGRRGVFFRVQLGALGGAPLFPTMPPATPVARRSTDTKKAPRQATFVSTLLLKAPAKVGLPPAQPGAAPLFLAVIPGAASGQLEHSPTTDQDGGLGLERRPLLPTLPPASPRAAARRSTVTGIHEWRRARHLLTRPDTTPPPSHPAWRGACCSHGSQHRGDGLRGASRQGVTGHDETHLGAGIGAARRSGHRA